jgi:hypothetical protein
MQASNTLSAISCVTVNFFADRIASFFMSAKGLSAISRFRTATPNIVFARLQTLRVVLSAIVVRK